VFAKKWGDVKTAYIGLGIFFFAVIGIGLANSGWMLYALMLPYAFTGLAGPTIQSIMSKNTSSSEQGELQGSITSIISLAEIIGPVLMMALMSWTTVGLAEQDKIYGSPYFAAAIFVLLGLFFFHRAMRKRV
jgi:MFS transporter, DHA1 family, tetracycline resistance protein